MSITLCVITVIYGQLCQYQPPLGYGGYIFGSCTHVCMLVCMFACMSNCVSFFLLNFSLFMGTDIALQYDLQQQKYTNETKKCK